MPARDEADTIAATIASLGMQEGVDPSDFEVLVLANNCDDDTADQARRSGERFQILKLEVIERRFPEEEANAGAARRFLMDEAACRLPEDGVIASTDGDTIVNRDWLSLTLRAIDAGADLVGGRILARAASTTPDDIRLRRMYLADTVYRFLMAEAEDLIDPGPDDPWPRHFQHFGASLAVTCRAYLAIGGLPHVPCLEDVAMYDALRRKDAAIRHSMAVHATTSARLTGRVGIGLSTQLGEWKDMIAAGRSPMMESADFVIARVRERRRLREIWTNERLIRSGETFGAFCDRELADFQPPVVRVEPLNDAIANLRIRLVDMRRAGRASLLSYQHEQVKPIGLLTRAMQVTE